MKKTNAKLDVELSLQQLENDYWEEDSKFPTPLVESVYKFRKIPLKDLTIEQLRLLIGQNEGLRFLIPLALKELNKDILVEGDYYRGDLLNMVFKIKNSFWQKNNNHKLELQAILRQQKGRIEADNENNIHRQILRRIEEFINN